MPQEDSPITTKEAALAALTEKTREDFSGLPDEKFFERFEKWLQEYDDLLAIAKRLGVTPFELHVAEFEGTPRDEHDLLLHSLSFPANRREAEITEAEYEMLKERYQGGSHKTGTRR